MLWSLFKIILFVVAVAALTLGAEWLLESEGGLLIQFGGWELSLGVLQAAIAAVLLVAVVWLGLMVLGFLHAVFKFLNGDETAISRYFDRNREQKGYREVGEAMMALASGDGATALSKATKAERHLQKPELTTLLVAQAAEMQGDKIRADQAYKKLLKDDRTRFVGVRGLMKAELDKGNTDVAMKLAEKAFALQPRHVDTQDTLLKLQADSGDWTGARQTLGAKLKYGALPRDVHKRRDAVLALSEAGVLLNGAASEAEQLAAIEANKQSPDLVPAAAMAARALVEQGKKRQATKVITKAWIAQPHPDLAAAFAAIEPDEAPAARLKRFRALTKHREGDADTRMLLAELHIAAEDFPAARAALGDLADTQPTQRSLTLMAAIERGEGAEDAVIRAWLAKAVTAPRGPQWVCDNCNHIHGTWAPVCDNCGGFDTLSWQTPPESEASVMAGSDMLPLIVAAPTSEPAPEVEAEVVEEAEQMDGAQVEPETTPEPPHADYVDADAPVDGEILAPEVEAKH
ncbi:heme biosynthesis protein HemY [Aliiroseovarius sp.]|uniref:heme biosynthesis protein HemY n=1 Tax=Aliiroseovarius sp. TaxID=1872442 RepID=UPI003BAA8529